MDRQRLGITIEEIDNINKSIDTTRLRLLDFFEGRLTLSDLDAMDLDTLNNFIAEKENIFKQKETATKEMQDSEERKRNNEMNRIK